ncbi:MAG TPA: oligopeptidase A [Methylococcaceae bacterium]|nr:oligopeptidase A [Methylococcaceae bacterium]
MTDKNPLLESFHLPPFSRIRPEHVGPAIRHLLAENRKAVDALLGEAKCFTWNSLVVPLENLDDRLGRAWSPVGHLNAVVNSDELRTAYNACLPLLSEYGTELGHNRKLFEAYKMLAERAGFLRLDDVQKKIVDDALRDFHLSGVDLPDDKKARFKDIARELSEITSKFEDNLLDATHGWHKRIVDPAHLAGLPESAQTMARERAEQDEVEGWLFTLEFPSYVAVMTYADDRELRREMYEAYVTRASDVGPNAGKWDNTELMERILKLRHEEAQLLGYANFAELSLTTKMAESSEQVLGFLRDLAERSRPVARRDLDELEAFAREEHGVEKLEVWDIGYYAEKLRQHRYQLSEEEVRPYFPAEQATAGMFAIVEKLYGIRIGAVEGVDVWHPDVRFYEIRDAAGNNNNLRGQFYLDLYARPKKRGGAWMDDCVTRRKLDGAIQTPVAYLTCNFPPPTREQPSLLRHDDVVTLFHEFGHGLHHMLTKVDYLAASGIHGVEWDAVELPSQFMENFCWEREALDLISGHWQTGEKLPEDLYRKMLAAKNFQSGMQMVRQLEFAIFDLRMHGEYDPEKGGRVYEILDEVRRQVAVVVPPAFNRFPHSFSHIFAGGYAAGYYSYKWAEVLSADAYSLFEETGVFNPETGRSFLENVLEKGGSRPAMELFHAFRGREPAIDALLRHNGIAG